MADKISCYTVHVTGRLIGHIYNTTPRPLRSQLSSHSDYKDNLKGLTLRHDCLPKL